MKITYIAWKQVICSDVNRLIYGIKGPGLHNTGDQAIQNFNSLNENPGLWRGFTGSTPIPGKPGIDLPLKNSVNPLNLWYSTNAARKNPVKINHEIWDRNGDHAKRIIESWYLGYMRILRQLLQRIVDRDGAASNASILLEYVDDRLSRNIEIRTNVLKWIHDTQDGFCAMTLDTSFMANDNIADLKGFVEDYYYLVVKCVDGQETYNMALMANSKSVSLHPGIRAYLCGNKFGGEDVDIDVSTVAASPDAQRFLSALYSYRNIILYGPPGTGKTHLLTELDRSFNAEVLFDDLDTEAPFRVTGDNGVTAKAWCTFHPNYSYETFVCGLTPVITPGNKLGFKPHIGPMLKLAKKAEAGVKSLLIIDEINRGNTDAIFGNASAIIDPLMNDTVTLPNPITDADGNEIAGFSSSENLFIVGTMNSLDKSTSPLSAELKRKFCIVELAPNVEVLRSYLTKNTSVPAQLVEFTCKIMEAVNERIHDFCGKEYELGQGYFWGLVEAHEKHNDVLAEILRNKIIPHLRDVLPSDTLSDFFGPENLDLLYIASDLGFEIADCTMLTNAQILNAFSSVIGSTLRFEEDPDAVVPQTLEEYENAKISLIRRHLHLYKNVIISGCSGSGKSYYVSKIVEDGGYSKTAKTHWHNSTEYSDVIEGISATLSGTDVTYSIQPGAIRKLAEDPATGKKLMVIENISKSNAAENFGELITLLEPDKRNLHITGYEGQISLPSDFQVLCTMAPGAGSQKLDSALKRRFSIIEFGPDYTALSLKLGIIEHPIGDVPMDTMDSAELKNLAVVFLRKVNESLKQYIGPDAQIGHAVFWGLSDECTFAEVCKFMDEHIIPVLEDYCVDEEIAQRIFGAMSPLMKHYSFGVEIARLNTLDNENRVEAIEGMLKNA